jgi:hypothetical protein
VLSEADPYPPEMWARAGLESTPAVVMRMLGFDGAADTSPDHVSTFRIVASNPDVVHLDAVLPVMHVVMVGRKVEPTRRMLTTVLHYRRPVVARLIWAVIGPLHRRTAGGIITSKIGMGE